MVSARTFQPAALRPSASSRAGGLLGASSSCGAVLVDPARPSRGDRRVPPCGLFVLAALPLRRDAGAAALAHPRLPARGGWLCGVSEEGGSKSHPPRQRLSATRRCGPRAVVARRGIAMGRSPSWGTAGSPHRVGALSRAVTSLQRVARVPAAGRGRRLAPLNSNASTSCGADPDGVLGVGSPSGGRRSCGPTSRYRSRAPRRVLQQRGCHASGIVLMAAYSAFARPSLFSLRSALLFAHAPSRLCTIRSISLMPMNGAMMPPRP